MLPIVAGVALCLSAFYWAYKKFRGPVYVPGSVAKLALQHPNLFDVADKTFGNDDRSLSASSSSKIKYSYWTMSTTIRLYYFSVPHSDASKPILLGIHGGPSLAPYKLWSLSPSLGSLYLYHARGCGLSTRPFREWPSPGRMWPGMQIVEKELGIGAQIQDIERIRRTLSTDKLVLIGHSFGGFIATLYAAEFPDHVQALVLLEPAGVLQLPPPKGSPDLFLTMRTKLQEQGNADHIAEFESFFKRYFDFSMLPKSTEESLARLHGEFSLHFSRAAGDEPTSMMTREAMEAMIDDNKVGGMACYATYLSMGMEHNYKTQLRKAFRDTIFPVLILHGDKDLVPDTATKEYQELFPSATLKVIEGANHFLYDHPQVSILLQEILAAKA